MRTQLQPAHRALVISPERRRIEMENPIAFTPKGRSDTALIFVHRLASAGEYSQPVPAPEDVTAHLSVGPLSFTGRIGRRPERHTWRYRMHVNHISSMPVAPTREANGGSSAVNPSLSLRSVFVG